MVVYAHQLTRRDRTCACVFRCTVSHNQFRCVCMECQRAREQSTCWRHRPKWQSLPNDQVRVVQLRARASVLTLCGSSMATWTGQLSWFATG